MKALRILLLALMSLLAVSCSIVEDETECPGCRETVHWNYFYNDYGEKISGFLSYGDIKLSDYGGEDAAWDLEDYCEWDVYYKSSKYLEMAGCDDGVIFSWLNGELIEIRLFGNWEGHTINGFGIGDWLDDFVEYNDDFSCSYSYSDAVCTLEFYGSNGERYKIEVEFDKERLCAVYLSR